MIKYIGMARGKYATRFTFRRYGAILTYCVDSISVDTITDALDEMRIKDAFDLCARHGFQD